jgi:hypothetical protein
VVGEGGVRACHRCHGIGRCWLCQNVTIADLVDPPELNRHGG